MIIAVEDVMDEDAFGQEVITVIKVDQEKKIS